MPIPCLQLSSTDVSLYDGSSRREVIVDTRDEKNDMEQHCVLITPGPRLKIAALT